MTAAFGELFGPAVRARGGRVVCVLALVLPVPLFAALGLSLPLPATVERLAARLVPFADQGAVPLSSGGSIVLARGEAQEPAAETVSAHGSHLAALSARQGSDRATPHTVGAQAPTVARPDPKTGDEAHGGGAATAGGGDERAPATPAASTATDAAPTSTTTSTPVTNPPAEEPVKPSEPTPTQVIETTVNATTGVVESATATAVETTSETAKETVATATETASGVVGVPKKP